MTRETAEACRECVVRFIGPALDREICTVGVARCGGCGRDVLKHRVTYWFPWPEDVVPV